MAIRVFAAAAGMTAGMAMPCHADTSHPEPSAAELVAQAEARRIEVIRRISPTVVCIFDDQQRGGGSGVLIDEQGYGLTNYHVIAGMLATRRGLGGLSDGRLYDLEVLGVDPGGDVAMFRLHGRDAPVDRFAYAPLGDSDSLKVGDRVLAMGNPFILAEDYTPTVTMGLVTGVNRYQWGQGGALEYADCIQTDAPINPGNSGGPLFDAGGRVVGINGRISVNTRGRFNVGFGYAISINQIKRFLPTLRAGLPAHHGTIQATVHQQPDGALRFNAVMKPGPAYDAGVRLDDRLAAIAGRVCLTANEVASVLRTYPAHWPLPLRIERDGEWHEPTVYLEPVRLRLPVPLTVNRRANQQELIRVLDRHGRAVGVGEDTARWEWQVRREMLHKDGEPVASERFTCNQGTDDLLRCREHLPDGTSGSEWIADDVRVVRSIAGTEDSYELAPESGMVFSALYVALFRLSHPSGGLVSASDSDSGSELRGIRHVGSDAVYERDENGRLIEHVCHALEWPLAGYATVRLVFMDSTALLHRMVVTDHTSGAVARITWDDYREFDGVLRPTLVTISQGQTRMVEHWTGWRRIP